jgi:hypothetical protein
VVPVEADELEAMFGAVEQALRIVFIDSKRDVEEVERINKKLEKVGRTIRIGKKGAIVGTDGNPLPSRKKA